MKNLEAFHAERKDGLGGSDIGAILGMSKYRTPVDVWAEKTGRAAPAESNLAMRFGTYAEQFVAEEYTAQRTTSTRASKALLPKARSKPK